MFYKKRKGCERKGWFDEHKVIESLLELHWRGFMENSLLKNFIKKGFQNSKKSACVMVEDLALNFTLSDSKYCIRTNDRKEGQRD